MLLCAVGRRAAVGGVKPALFISQLGSEHPCDHCIPHLVLSVIAHIVCAGAAAARKVWDLREETL